MKPERIQLVVDEHAGWGYLEPVVGLHRRYLFEHHALAEAFAVYCRHAAGVFDLEVAATVRGRALDVLLLPGETTAEEKVQSFLRATALTLDATPDEPPADAAHSDESHPRPALHTTDEDTDFKEPAPESG